MSLNNNKNIEINKVNEAFFNFLIKTENELVEELCGIKHKRNPNKEYKRLKTSQGIIHLENGTFKHRFQIIKNKKTGEIKTPLKEYLDIEKYQHMSEDFKLKIISKLNTGTYQRSSEDVLNSFHVKYTPQHLHRLFKENKNTVDIEEMKNISNKTEDKVLMGDGVKVCGHKHQVKVIASLDEENNKTLVSKEVNTTWNEMFNKVDLTKYIVFVGDCEPELRKTVIDNGLSFQICHVHAFNQLQYFLWKDGVLKKHRDNAVKYLKKILFTLQNSTKKFFNDFDEKRLQNRIEDTKFKLSMLTNLCYKNEYFETYRYLMRNMRYLLTGAKLAISHRLKIPWNTNQIERCMREIGYRTKKKGMMWGEEGLDRITNLILKRYFLPINERFYKNYMINNTISELKVQPTI